MRKGLTVLLLIIISFTTVFAQSVRERDENYAKALEYVEERYYEKAVEYLMAYIENHPNDNEAPKFLEEIYEKFYAFQMEYLKGKDLYNRHLYDMADDQFRKALEIGFSEKLQYYLSEIRKIKFRIRNTFIDTTVGYSGNNITIEWHNNELTNVVLTNATAYFVRSDNLQLMNVIYYFNKNKLMLPFLGSYLNPQDIFTNFEVTGSKASFAKNYLYDNFIILFYPRTPDGIYTQPIVEIFTRRPGLSDDIELLEPIAMVKTLPMFTNYYAGNPPVAVRTIVTDRNDALLETAEQFLNVTNAESTQATATSTQTRRPAVDWLRGGRWLWWLLLLLLLLYLLYRLYREWKRREFERREALNWARADLRHFYEIAAVGEFRGGAHTPGSGRIAKTPVKPAKKRGGKLPLWLIAAGLLALTVAAGWVVASDTTDALDRQFGRETQRYYSSHYSLTNLTPAPYALVAKFYTFDRGVTIPDYRITLDFVKEVVKSFRENAATYYEYYDYANFALNSFTVYYLDKDFEFYSKSISRLREGNLERIANEILAGSDADESKGRYLSALIRYTGYIAIAGANLPPNAFERLNRLGEAHKLAMSKYESYYLIRRLNRLIESENPPAMKAIGCFLEMDAYERYFKLPDDLAQWKTDLAQRIADNYKILMYNDLIREGGRAYAAGDFVNARKCYQYAEMLIPYPGNSQTIRTNLGLIRLASAGRYTVTLTNRIVE